MSRPAHPDLDGAAADAERRDPAMTAPTPTGTPGNVGSTHPGAPPRARVMGVDVTRGLAVLGMAAVHILPLTHDDGSPTLVAHLAAGRSAAAFAFVAGISFAFLTGGMIRLVGRAATGAAVGIAMRGVLIGLLGLTLAYLGVADIILASYGLMFLLALPLLRVGPRVLIAAAVAFSIVGPVVIVALHRAGAIRADAFDPTLTTLVTQPGTLLELLLVSGVYPVVVYLGYLCAGLAVGRLDLSSRRLAAGLVGVGVVLTALGQATSALLLFRFGGLAHLVDHVNASAGTDATGGPTTPAAPTAADTPDAAADEDAAAQEDDAAADEEDEDDDSGDAPGTGEGTAASTAPTDAADAASDSPTADTGADAADTSDATDTTDATDTGDDAGDDLVTGQDLQWDADGADSWWYLALASPHASTTPDVANTLGSALAVLGCALLVCRTSVGARLLRPLADLGSMPLTLYTGHLLILWTGVLEDRPVLLFAALTVGMLAFAVAWRAVYGQGPLERMLAAASGRARRLVTGPPDPSRRPSHPTT